MNFSAESQARIEQLAAEMIVKELREVIDFEELVTLPLNVVAHIIGLSAKRAGQILETRPMGTRHRGVSIKALREYQNRGKQPPPS